MLLQERYNRLAEEAGLDDPDCLLYLRHGDQEMGALTIDGNQDQSITVLENGKEVVAKGMAHCGPCAADIRPASRVESPLVTNLKQVETAAAKAAAAAAAASQRGKGKGKARDSSGGSGASGSGGAALVEKVQKALAAAKRVSTAGEEEAASGSEGWKQFSGVGNIENVILHVASQTHGRHMAQAQARIDQQGLPRYPLIPAGCASNCSVLPRERRAPVFGGRPSRSPSPEAGAKAGAGQGAGQGGRPAHGRPAAHGPAATAAATPVQHGGGCTGAYGGFDPEPPPGLTAWGSAAPGGVAAGGGSGQGSRSGGHVLLTSQQRHAQHQQHLYQLLHPQQAQQQQVYNQHPAFPQPQQLHPCHGQQQQAVYLQHQQQQAPFLQHQEQQHGMYPQRPEQQQERWLQHQQQQQAAYVQRQEQQQTPYPQREEQLQEPHLQRMQQTPYPQREEQQQEAFAQHQERRQQAPCPQRQEQQQEPYPQVREVEADDVDTDPDSGEQRWDCAICGSTHKLDWCCSKSCKNSAAVLMRIDGQSTWFECSRCRAYCVRVKPPCDE